MTPNVGRAQGITLPRLMALMHGYNTRRREDMEYHANAVAMAYHKPEDLTKMFKPQVRELARKAERQPDAWDHDDWWAKKSL